jgi:hypothetical protein
VCIVLNLTACYIKIHFNIISPSLPSPFEKSHLFIFSNTNSVGISHFSCATCLTHLMFLDPWMSDIRKCCILSPRIYSTIIISVHNYTHSHPSPEFLYFQLYAVSHQINAQNLCSSAAISREINTKKSNSSTMPWDPHPKSNLWHPRHRGG